MSSIYLYIIYISRPWFKGSGAVAGSGSISGTSILLCPFCRYAIVHTNHLFCEKERVQRWPSFSLSSSTGGKNGCVPKGFNQKHAGCRETSGVFCCEKGAGSAPGTCRSLIASERFARMRNEELGMRNEGGGFAEILRLRSQLFWHSLSHIRRFSPLRMTKRGDARRSVDRRFSSYRQPSPRGEGAPKGRIGHSRHERERERASQVDDL